MEALTAVSVACLTIYDMCKAVDRAMSFSGIRLVEKTGGRSGTFQALMALLSIPEALARVLDGLDPLETENVSLEAARGRVLAERPRRSPHPAAVRCLRHGWLCGARGGCG